MRAIAIKSLIIAISLSWQSGLAFAKPITNWTGVYIGANVGAIFNDVTFDANHLGFISPKGNCNIDSDLSTFYPGIQLGYTFQFDSNIVVGIQGDFSYSFNRHNQSECVCLTMADYADRFSLNNDMQGAIEGRIGYSLSNQLQPFLLTGISFSDLKLSYSNEGGNYYSKSTTQPGWRIGGGIEWGMSESLSISAQYFYTDYNNVSLQIPFVYGLFDPNSHANAQRNTNNVQLSLNYWIK